MTPKREKVIVEAYIFFLKHSLPYGSELRPQAQDFYNGIGQVLCFSTCISRAVGRRWSAVIRSATILTGILAYHRAIRKDPIAPFVGYGRFS